MNKEELRKILEENKDTLREIKDTVLEILEEKEERIWEEPKFIVKKDIPEEAILSYEEAKKLIYEIESKGEKQNKGINYIWEGNRVHNDPADAGYAQGLELADGTDYIVNHGNGSIKIVRYKGSYINN